MSKRPQTRANRAGLGLALLVCTVALLLGTGLDFATASGSRFWFDQQPGALAALGAGAAVTAVLLAHCVRLLLRRPSVTPVEGERDVHA